MPARLIGAAPARNAIALVAGEIGLALTILSILPQAKWGGGAPPQAA
jgi:hypothetical protein